MKIEYKFFHLVLFSFLVCFPLSSFAQEELSDAIWNETAEPLVYDCDGDHEFADEGEVCEFLEEPAGGGGKKKVGDARVWNLQDLVNRRLAQVEKDKNLPDYNVYRISLKGVEEYYSKRQRMLVEATGRGKLILNLIGNDFVFKESLLLYVPKNKTKLPFNRIMAGQYMPPKGNRYKFTPVRLPKRPR